MDILEWGVIAVMGIAIFLFGPEKGAEIAKKLGAARRDLDAATKQLSGMSKELGGGTGGIEGILTAISTGVVPEQIPQSAASVGAPLSAATGTAAVAAAGVAMAPAASAGGATPAVPVAPKPEGSSGDRLLVDMARKLGISTRGKTREDIQGEIVARAAQTPAVAEKPAPAAEAQPAAGSPGTASAS